MSDEIELVSKSVGAAVGALAEASGVTDSTQELTGFINSFLRPRREIYAAKQLIAAAEKIKRSGLPVAAIKDRQLKDLVEGGSLEDDPDMQERWANLLANAATTNTQRHYSVYARMLAEIEPSEAALLDSIADSPIFAEVPLTRRISVAQLTDGGISTEGVDNLIQLGILRHEEPTDPAWEEIGQRHSLILNLRFTAQGWAFVQACRTPHSG